MKLKSLLLVLVLFLSVITGYFYFSNPILIRDTEHNKDKVSQNGNSIMVKEDNKNIIYSFNVGNEGGEFKVDDTNTVLDGVVVQVPVGALNQNTKLSLGYYDGSIPIRAGEKSGIVYILEASNNLKQFSKPVRIITWIDKDTKPPIVIGYKIEENGRLRPLYTLYDDKSGKTEFLTSAPLMMTWVYLY